VTTQAKRQSSKGTVVRGRLPERRGRKRGKPATMAEVPRMMKSRRWRASRPRDLAKPPAIPFVPRHMAC
jgi:hypothetical protein